MPREGTLRLHDLIRGDVDFQWVQEQDHVIQRADGTFIYHLANVVDDKDYEITHVISPSNRQALTLEALVEMIEEVGRVAVERDALYNVVRRWEGREAPAPALTLSVA